MANIEKMPTKTPVKKDPAVSRDRIRQDKFSTLHLACFAPEKPVAKS